MLFGHQDDVNQSDTSVHVGSDTGTQQPVGVNPLAVDSATGASLPAVSESQSPAAEESQQSVLDQPTAPDPVSTAPQSTAATPASPPAPDPATPFGDNVVFSDKSAHDEPTPPPATDAAEAPAFTSAGLAAATPADPDPPAPSTATPSADDTDLLNLKQQAVAELGPLVGQLDQSPIDRFRTTMMLIQSTDNSSLLKAAYEAAQAITDEKARAQALLDVVNEINYFTQQSDSTQQSA